MYRVAIVVNENEMLHSVYANAEETLKKALSLVYREKVNELYSFVIFDKFNIYSLFEKGDNNIWTFDSIFIATNACNNKEITQELSLHSNDLATFIDDEKGNQHGIFVSNQQKLGGDFSIAQPIPFLPTKFTYKLIKRKEKLSSDGKVAISCKGDLLVSFPLLINDLIIEQACSGMHNQFMPHKYRFYIEPNYESSYEIIYCDDSYTNGSSTEKRSLLLKSRIGNERVVVSSVVLDWAEHLNQLANIIIYITEGVNQFAFVGKSKCNDFVFSRYIRKARDCKMAIKEYNENTILAELTKVESEAIDKHKLYIPHKVFVFSSMWSGEEVKKLWSKYIILSDCNIAFYRLVSDSSREKDELMLESIFAKSIKNSQIFLCAEEWLTANFIVSRWRKSIWTYEYILDFYTYLGFSKCSFIEPVYREITTHYKIKNIPHVGSDQAKGALCTHEKMFEKKCFQTYDNVFNSTCSCCNVLAKLYTLCQNNGIKSLKLGTKNVSVDELLKEVLQLGNWIVYKMNCEDYRSRISWQDYIMAFVALYDSGYINDVMVNDNDIYSLIKIDVERAIDIVKENALQMRNGYHFVKEETKNSDICKALKFLYVCYDIERDSEETIFALLDVFEQCLEERQQYSGQWNNLSETTEITLSLLCRNEFNINIQRTERFDTMINRAINIIQNSFDYEKSCWLDDENTTAKSLNVILHYDEIFNYAFDDFLADLVGNANKYSQAVNVNNNIKTLDYAQEQNQKIQVIAEERKEKIDKQRVELKYSKKLIKKYKFIVGVLASAFALSVLFIICIFGILASNYSNVLKDIIAENIAVIISTALGIVVTAILTGFAQHTKSKLIEEYERKDDGKEE